MRTAYITSIWLLVIALNSACFAQLKVKSYDEAKALTWGAENPIFNPTSSERFKNQDVVVVGIDFKAEYLTSDNMITASTLGRKQLLINSRPELLATMKFSDLWPELQKHRQTESQFIGLRVRKSSGTFDEVKISTWEQKLYLNLSVGDIVDCFVFRSEVVKMEGGHIFQPIRLYNQYIYPIMAAKYSLEISKELYFIIKSYNDAPKYKNKQTPNTIQYNYEFTNAERHPIQTFSPFLRTCPTTLIKVAFTETDKDLINSFVDPDAPGRAKHVVTPKDVLRFFSDKLDKKVGGKIFFEALSKEWTAALKRKKITPKSGQTVFVTELYEYIRNRYAVRGEKPPFGKNEMLEAMSYTLTKNKISHDLFVAVPIYISDAKEIALYDEAILVLKFKDDRTLLISTFGENDCINDIPTDIFAAKGYLINISEKPDYQKIKPYAFPTPESNINSLKINFAVNIFEDAAIIALNGQMDGALRKEFQNIFVAASDYWESEAQKFKMPPLTDEQKNSYDSLRKARISNFYSKLNKNRFTATKAVVQKVGRQTDNTAFEFSAEIKTEDIKLMDKTKFVPSELIRNLPSTSSDDNLSRRGDIIFHSSGILEYNFKIAVPPLYRATVDQIEKNVKNDVGEASLTLTNKSTEVEISFRYGFKNYTETSVYWPKVLDILKIVEQFKAITIDFSSAQ